MALERVMMAGLVELGGQRQQNPEVVSQLQWTVVSLTLLIVGAIEIAAYQSFHVTPMANLINEMGKQRTLSQQPLFYAHDTRDEGETARSLAAELGDKHRALVSRYGARPLLSFITPRSTPLTESQVLANLIENHEALSKRVTRNSGLRPEALQNRDGELVTLLDTLDRAVSVASEEASRRLSWLSGLQIIVATLFARSLSGRLWMDCRTASATRINSSLSAPQDDETSSNPAISE